MAYSGTGTKENPFIVDNWTDFLSVCNIEDSYIKWADRPIKTIESVTIASTIPSQFELCDFNGWTFEDITIQLPDNSSTVFSARFGSRIIGNMNVKHLYVNRPDIVLFDTNQSKMYCCNFEEVVIEEAAENNAFWTDMGVTRPFFPDCHYCTIKYKTEGRNIMSPNGSFYACNVEIDYKALSTTVGNKEKNGVFQSSQFVNCNLFGKIDLRNGSGSFGIIRKSKSLSLTDSVVNIEFLNNGVDLSNKGSWLITYGKSCFVTNRGNCYSLLSALVISDIQCFSGDVKNIDYLAQKGFNAVHDDSVRNQQYMSYSDLVDDDARGYFGDWTWRQNPAVNNGDAFIPFWFYPTAPAPQPAEPVDENPYITVYDMETPQNGFNNHGLGILRPTQCPVIEELNGEYTVNMIHPLDEEGMWRTLLEMNIVKVLGQLFVIQRVDEVQRGGSGYISVYAEHISYILNDSWIFPPFSVMGYYGQTLIDSIMAQATDMGGDWQTRYYFDITTNINAPDDFYDWDEMKDGATPYEMLLGGNGFIAKLGGELYRDNFALSIQDRMQGAQDNAFEMSIGYNLTGIKRTVDLSTFCTYFRGYDVSDGNYDTWFAVSWDPSTLPRAYPRNIVRSQNFTYDNPETAFGQLERDTMAFFNANCAPLISYELTVHDLKNNPDFKMFTNNYRYKVGDKGRVWDERLKAWITLEITKTQKNGITGECEKVIIGTQRSFTRPAGYYPIIPSMVIPSANIILEGVTPLSFYSNGDDLVDYTIFGNAGGVGEMSDNLHHGGINYGFYNPSNGEYIPGSTSWIASNEAIEVEPDTTYTFSLQYKPVESLGLFIIEYDENGNYITSSYGNTSASVTSYTFTTSATTKLIRCEITGIGSYGVSDFGDFNLNEGSTQLPYEPYGCMITVIVSDGTRTQTVQITANEPLEEGESISMSESETAIPTYEGLCSIDVVATVQPRIRITYKEG